MERKDEREPGNNKDELNIWVDQESGLDHVGSHCYGNHFLYHISQESFPFCSTGGRPGLLIKRESLMPSQTVKQTKGIL